MNGTARSRRRLIAVVIAIALAGCGPTPPQAPFHQAKKLDAATSDISTACGLSFQVSAFPGDHRAELASLDASAKRSVRSLASVYALNRVWIYQGETVGAIVLDSVSMLKSCGLNQAAATLERLAARHRT